MAVNKCDKPEAEMEACIEDLALHGVTLEEAGGDIIGVKISALNGLCLRFLSSGLQVHL